MRPFGLRSVAEMLNQGLPPELSLPLKFLFGGPIPESAMHAARRIEQRRAVIRRRDDRYELITVDPTGKVRWLVRSDEGNVTSEQLADAISVNRRWGMFLHLCSEAIAPRTILEIGSCVGISGAYLASSTTRPRLLTLEGSPDLADIAGQTLRAVTGSAAVIQGRFEEILPHVTNSEIIDLAYVDGHHDGIATRNYVGSLIPRLSEGALLILDDIRLYREMWEAWSELRQLEGMRCSVDVGRFGLLVWKEDASSPLHFDLAHYTGRWPLGGERHSV